MPQAPDAPLPPTACPAGATPPWHLLQALGIAVLQPKVRGPSGFGETFLTPARSTRSASRMW